MKKRWSWRTNVISWSRILGMHPTWMSTERKYYWVQRICSNHERFSAGATENLPGWEKLTQKRLRGPTIWKDMLKSASRDIANWRTKRQSSETKSQVLAWMITISGKRNLNQLENCQKYAHKVSWNAYIGHAWNDIVSWQTKRLNNSTKYQLHALMTIISKKKNWSPWENCLQFAHKLFWKCLWLARVGRPDIRWSVNKLARTVTKWTGACDKSLARLISHIHHTNDYRQYCHVGNTAQRCRLGLFQDPDFAGDLEDSKSTSGGNSCIFVSRTFVPISWMCKKQSSVSHSGARDVTFIEQYQNTNQPISKKLFAESQIQTQTKGKYF